MGKSLNEIAQQLKDAKHTTKARSESTADVKVQLIYAFNGTGKTRLSREFKSLVSPKNDAEADETGLARDRFIYYNAFTEDLFYWDNDLEFDDEPKLKIQPNTFTEWVLNEQGQDQNVIDNFQKYANRVLTPKFDSDFTEVTFSLERGNDEYAENIKISKGEESNFIWCVFYSLFEQIIDVLNVAEPSDRETNQFDQLEYVFIDDPVTSLDENHLIQLAVDLALLIKSSKSELKFIITTHNPLFYNVLHNELRNNTYKKYRLEMNENGEYDLKSQSNDSPFSYHLFLLKEIEKAIETGQLKKFHLNYLRNILEKTATFLGYSTWGELLRDGDTGKISPYETRIINISSHSKVSSEEVAELTEDNKRMIGYIVKKIKDTYKFK